MWTDKLGFHAIGLVKDEIAIESMHRGNVMKERNKKQFCCASGSGFSCCLLQ
jgi:hypothetical protein